MFFGFILWKEPEALIKQLFIADNHVTTPPYINGYCPTDLDHHWEPFGENCYYFGEKLSGQQVKLSFCKTCLFS